MKLLIAFFSLLLLNNPAETLLVVDKDLKKPLGHTNEFTLALYLQRSFPVYASDVPVIVATIDKAVKTLDKGQPCQQVVKLAAEHTSISIAIDCEDTRKISVNLITEITEVNTSYSYTLVRNEMDSRKVQRRLLDFATYLTQ